MDGEELVPVVKNVHPRCSACKVELNRGNTQTYLIKYAPDLRVLGMVLVQLLLLATSSPMPQ